MPSVTFQHNLTLQIQLITSTAPEFCFVYFISGRWIQPISVQLVLKCRKALFSFLKSPVGLLLSWCWHASKVFSWEKKGRKTRRSEKHKETVSWSTHARHVCDRYLTRAKLTVENQYESLRSVISEVIQRKAWKVEQINFITGVRSVNRQDLSKNLKFFQVPEANIQSIYSKLTMRVFDVEVCIRTQWQMTG